MFEAPVALHGVDHHVAVIGGQAGGYAGHPGDMAPYHAHVAGEEGPGGAVAVAYRAVIRARTRSAMAPAMAGSSTPPWETTVRVVTSGSARVAPGAK